MKNLFKSKKIYAFLLTMIMCISLFFFSACSEGDEKLLFKIVYRPYADSKSEFFGGTYKQKIKEDLDETTEYVISYIVGAFGIGEIEVRMQNKDTGAYETIKLSPEFPNDNEYYYSNLLGISKSNTYYNSVVSKIVQTTNIYYDYTSTSGKPAIMVLSNHQVTGRDLEDNIVKYSEEERCFKAQTSMQLVGSNKYFSYDQALNSGDIYLYESSEGYSFIFIGGYVSGGSSYNSTTNASRFVTSLLSTNYNNIQQTVGKVEIYNGSDTGISNSSSWAYSLTENEMDNVYNAQSYLDIYLDKYFNEYKIEIVKAILTRNENEWTDELERAYNLAKRTNVTAEQRKKNIDSYVDKACEYIDHLGLIPEEAESITNFMVENVIGYNVTVTETLKASCVKCLTAAHEAIGYVPLLEVLSYELSEQEEIKIDGYVQSIIILTEDQDYNFTSLLAIFSFEEEQTLEPYLVTVRHQEDGYIDEYPIALNEEDASSGAIEVSMEDILDSNEEGLIISKSEDPIKPGLFSKKTSIVDEAKKYAKMFTYSTSTENTDGMCWCFNNESSNFIQIILATNNLCVNQHLNLDVLFL